MNIFVPNVNFNEYGYLQIEFLFSVNIVLRENIDFYKRISLGDFFDKITRRNQMLRFSKRE